MEYNTSMTTKKRKRMGRPLRSAAEKQTYTVSARFTKAEARLLRADARAAGMKFGTYLASFWRARHGMGIK